MCNVRGNRKSSSGGGGSRDVRVNVEGREVFISRAQAVKFIESARSQLRFLHGIVESVPTCPEDLQTDVFEVFHHHLSTPVEQQLCEKDKPYDWIMESFLGIKYLGLAYFERDAAHKQRFINCFPHIIKWLNALLPVRDIYDDMNLYSSAAGEIYNICLSVHRSAFEEDEVLEFAVRAWIGVKTSDGKDRYTGRCLLACLMVLHDRTREDTRRIERALQACDTSADDLADKIVTRVEDAMGCSPMNVARAIVLTKIMARLAVLRDLFFMAATLKPNMGHCIVSLLKALVDGPKESEEYKRAISSSLVVIDCVLALQTVKYAITIVKEGILGSLLKLASASSDSKDSKDPTSSSLSTSVLQQLQLCLIFDGMIDSSREELYLLYTGEWNIKDLLKASPKRFRDVWKTFESLLLENAVLRCLLKGLYAPEDGICANRACRRLGFRTEFKKCAGCAFALYCKRSCQKADWSSHKVGCKNMNENSLCVTQDYCNRFPRKIATLQVNRLWNHIVSLSRRKSIPVGDVAVRISCLAFPFEIEVFDYHELLKDIEDDLQLALVANEMQRQSKKGRRDWVMVILCMPEMVFSFLAHLDNTWTRNVSEGVIPKDKKGTVEREPATFVDQEENALVCGKLDALRAGVQLAKRYATDMGETVWSEDVLDRATDDVLEDFEDVIGAFEFGPASDED